MERNEIIKLLMAVCVAYPHFNKQYVAMPKLDKDAAIANWFDVLRDTSYEASSKAFEEYRKSKQGTFYPGPSDIHNLAKKYEIDLMDIGASEDAEYRGMFPDWMKDGMNRAQRMERMQKAKLENKPNLRIAE